MLTKQNLQAAARHLVQNLERVDRWKNHQKERLFWLSQAVADWVFIVRCERDINAAGETDSSASGFLSNQLGEALKAAGEPSSADWISNAVLEGQDEQQLIELGSTIVNDLYAKSRTLR